jgi:hypothetical protein
MVAMTTWQQERSITIILIIVIKETTVQLDILSTKAICKIYDMD